MVRFDSQAFVNKKNEVPADFFNKVYMKGYLKTMPKKQRIWCMIHENNVICPSFVVKTQKQAPCVPRVLLSANGIN